MISESKTSRSRLISESRPRQKLSKDEEQEVKKKINIKEGPGALSDYAEYVKAGITILDAKLVNFVNDNTFSWKIQGGYVPGLILDPDKGIEQAVYAKNKGIDYSYADTSGGIGNLGPIGTGKGKLKFILFFFVKLNYDFFSRH